MARTRETAHRAVVQYAGKDQEVMLWGDVLVAFDEVHGDVKVGTHTRISADMLGTVKQRLILMAVTAAAALTTAVFLLDPLGANANTVAFKVAKLAPLLVEQFLA